MKVQTNKVPSDAWYFVAILKAFGLSVMAVTAERRGVYFERLEEFGREYNITDSMSCGAPKFKHRPVLTGIKISLASDEEIADRSWGEVRDCRNKLKGKRSNRHKRSLSAEAIFGPSRLYCCECSSLPGEKKYKGHICPWCSVEFTDPQVRFYRFGYIKLFKPVTNPITKQPIQNLPVLPIGLRTESDGLDVLYATVIRRNNARGDIQGAVHALFYGRYPNGRPVKRNGRQIHGILDMLRETRTIVEEIPEILL